MIKANNPELKSYFLVEKNNDFPIQNIPFGVFKTATQPARLCTRIGDHVIDLFTLNKLGFFIDLKIPASVFENRYINDFMALGKTQCRAVRDRISELLDDRKDKWNAHELTEHFTHNIKDVEILLPVKVTDYTDFYSSIEHATNVGTMFRGIENALMPNWRHLPVGYHGRASSIVVSGTPIKRPCGQLMPADATAPIYGPCRLLDFELEMAFIVGQATKQGDALSTKEAEDYIFGMVLFNDWSARDIQKWEYVPLGPFLGKSFASSISPWVVTLDALEHFRVPGPVQEPTVLPYLQYEKDRNLDIRLEVDVKTPEGIAQTVCRSNFKYMYWNMAQQLAHHTVNGCNLNVGDMCASGTISGKTPDSYGSMLEISWKGTKPVAMPDGTERKFIQDGDTVIIRGVGEKDGVRIGFGEVSGTIIPATPIVVS